jgi:hypothetical protein
MERKTLALELRVYPLCLSGLNQRKVADGNLGFVTNRWPNKITINAEITS